MASIGIRIKKGLIKPAMKNKKEATNAKGSRIQRRTKESP